MTKELSTETEDRIIVAARKEFEQKGFNGTRMQQIADLAGISKPALHYYFRSKDNLFKKIFDETLELYMPLINTWSDDTLTWEQKIKKFTVELMAFVEKGHMLFLVRELNRNPDLLSERIKKSKAQNKFVLYFDEAMAQQKVKLVDARILFDFCTAVCTISPYRLVRITIIN